LKDYLINELQINFDESLRQVEWLSVPDAYTRMKILVSSLANNLGSSIGNRITFEDKTHVGIKITHTLLASLAGLSRETVTMQINRLITEGYLSRQENALVVEKLDALTADSL
jgi:CRP-like cAMP-binding protein